MSWFKDEGGSTIDRGQRAEDRAQRFLEDRGLELRAAHYRVARGPSRHAGEVDLIMRDRDGTLVFVEVRSRRDASFGGAAASVGVTKQRRIRRAAEHYLSRMRALPACRFDVVAIDGERVEWIQAAFDAS
jgi:putative endonuclease